VKTLRVTRAFRADAVTVGPSEVPTTHAQLVTLCSWETPTMIEYVVGEVGGRRTAWVE
jgi:hypothetical protein